MNIFLHAGLPRTATTVLQTEVFPKLERFHYVGKNADNMGLQGKFQPVKFARALCEQVVSGDAEAMKRLRAFLPSLLHALKIAGRDKHDANVRQLAVMWANSMEAVASVLNDKPILYSDEALSESLSGMVGRPEYGDMVPIEQLHENGFTSKVSLSLVLRDPAEFLRASYYKAMEFRMKSGSEAYSFDDFILRQLAIYERSPSASRIFLCLHKTVIRHYQQLSPRLVVTHYRDLAASNHVVDTLLGVQSGEKPISLAQLPRENSSWRKKDANEYILRANGVPRGITIQQYAATFGETLRRHALDQLFASEA